MVDPFEQNLGRARRLGEEQRAEQERQADFERKRKMQDANAFVDIDAGGGRKVRVRGVRNQNDIGEVERRSLIDDADKNFDFLPSRRSEIPYSLNGGAPQIFQGAVQPMHTYSSHDIGLLPGGEREAGGMGGLAGEYAKDQELNREISRKERMAGVERKNLELNDKPLNAVGEAKRANEAADVLRTGNLAAEEEAKRVKAVGAVDTMRQNLQAGDYQSLGLTPFVAKTAREALPTVGNDPNKALDFAREAAKSRLDAYMAERDKLGGDNGLYTPNMRKRSGEIETAMRDYTTDPIPSKNARDMTADEYASTNLPKDRSDLFAAVQNFVKKDQTWFGGDPDEASRAEIVKMRNDMLSKLVAQGYDRKAAKDVANKDILELAKSGSNDAFGDESGALAAALEADY